MRQTNTVRLDDGLEARGKTDGSNSFFFKSPFDSFISIAGALTSGIPDS